jgi:formylglycine-generating enzyme required for sulfatase activity
MDKGGTVLVAIAGILLGAGGGSGAAHDPLDGGVGDAALPDSALDDVPPPAPAGCTPATQVTQSCAAGWCQVPPGCFLMGSPPTDPCRDDDETQHWVTLTHAFELGQTEVTQAEFQTAMGTNPSRFSACGGTCPVDTVTWHMAAAYANALSQTAGLQACYTCAGSPAAVSCPPAAAYEADIYACPGYLLPTEAEFEYAYRAGTTTQLYDGPVLRCWDVDSNADKIGWYIFNTAQSAGTHPTGEKQPNAWGLYDMGGNMEEWVHDGYAPYPSDPVVDPVIPITTEAAHSARGGSWITYAKDMRGCDRNLFMGTEAHSFRGFRVARTRQ